MAKSKGSGFSGGGGSYTAALEKYGGDISSSAFNNRGIPRGVASSYYRAFKNDEIKTTRNTMSYIYNNMVGDSWTTNSRESEPAIALRVGANALRAGDMKAAQVALNEFIKRETSTMTDDRRRAVMKYLNG